jgi:hypothetical protein
MGIHIYGQRSIRNGFWESSRIEKLVRQLKCVELSVFLDQSAKVIAFTDSRITYISFILTSQDFKYPLQLKYEFNIQRYE